MEARKFDFETCRAIKNSRPGTTINDVMLTVVAGGLRELVGFMNVALHTEIEDPLQRLAAVHEAAVKSKAYAQALGPRITMDITNVIPGNVLAVAMRASAATGMAEAAVIHNTIVTNVPGSPFQLYLCGAALVDSLSFGPLLPNMGLFHIIYSAVQNKQGSMSLSFYRLPQNAARPGFLRRMPAGLL